MSYFYKILIGACLALAFKIALVPDFPSVIALVSFVAAGLGVYFFESQGPNQKDRVDVLFKEMEDLASFKERFTKLEAHVERVDNRTRPPGR